MYYGDQDYREEDCAPDFRFESDRNNPNYVHQYTKYCEDLVKESKENVFERSISVEYTMPIKIDYMNIIHQTNKAILLNIDNVYKAWIPKSQIVAIGNDCIYITEYFSRKYSKEKIGD